MTVTQLGKFSNLFNVLDVLLISQVCLFAPHWECYSGHPCTYKTILNQFKDLRVLKLLIRI